MLVSSDDVKQFVPIHELTLVIDEDNSIAVTIEGDTQVCP